MRLSERLRRFDEENEETITINGVTYQKVDEENVDEARPFKEGVKINKRFVRPILKELKKILDNLEDDFDDNDYEEFKYQCNKLDDEYYKYLILRDKYKKLAEKMGEDYDDDEEDELYYKKGKGKGKFRR